MEATASAVLISFLSFSPQCQGTGMFQVQFLDYANPNQTDAQNRCCNRDADSQGNCRSPCRTFFTVCLQPQSSNRCIYGQASSGVLGSGSFVIPSNSLLQGQVTSWPVRLNEQISLSLMNDHGVQDTINFFWHPSQMHTEQFYRWENIASFM